MKSFRGKGRVARAVCQGGLVALFLSSSALATSPTTGSLLPNANQQFTDANGVPYPGGSVYFYTPNTSSFKSTFQDPLLMVPNTNPVILDSAGRAVIYGLGVYREVLKDASGNTIWDNLTADLLGEAASLLVGSEFVGNPVNGGTGLISPTAHQLMITEGASPMNLLGAGCANNSVLVFQTSADPTCTTTSLPGTIAQNDLVYASAANTLAGLASANNGVLITSGAGVPSISSTIPSATQDNITRTGTLVSGSLGAGYTIPLGTVTLTGALPYANYQTSGVGAGSYSCPTITLNLQGVVIAAVNGSCSPVSAISLNNAITGLGLTRTSTAVITVAAGQAADSTNAALMTTAGGTVTFSSSGSINHLDTGTVAINSWYAMLLIAHSDGSSVNLLATLETAGTPISPTLPSGYGIYRYIGSVQTDGSANLLSFTQRGPTFYRAAAATDVSGSNGATTAVLKTLSVPLSVQVQPLFRATPTSSTAANQHIVFSSPDEPDSAPSSTYYDIVTADTSNILPATLMPGVVYLTNTSGQIRTRSDASSLTYNITTRGWVDPHVAQEW